MSHDNNKKFYVYIYLDPRKPGKFTYKDLPFSFTYEPFYVGEGKNKRLLSHIINAKNNYDSLNKDSNKLKCYLIRKIIAETGGDPIVFKLRNFKTLDAAFTFEQYLIKKIGRRIKKEGPLTNILLGGRLSRKGFKHSEETKKKQSLKKMGELNPQYGKTGVLSTQFGVRGPLHSCYGKPRSDEFRAQLSIRNIKNNAVKYIAGWNKGKKCPQFQGENNGRYNGIPSPNEKIIEYAKEGLNVVDISKKFGFGPNCLKNRIKNQMNMNFTQLRKSLGFTNKQDRTSKI